MGTPVDRSPDFLLAEAAEAAPRADVRREARSLASDRVAERGGAERGAQVLQRRVSRRGVRPPAGARDRGRGRVVGPRARRDAAPLRRRGGLAPRAAHRVPRRGSAATSRRWADDAHLLQALRARRAARDDRAHQPDVRDDRRDDLPPGAADGEAAPGGAADAHHPDARRVVPRPAQRPLPAPDPRAHRREREAAPAPALPPAHREPDGLGVREPPPRAALRQHPVPDARARLRRAPGQALRPRRGPRLPALAPPARDGRAPAGRISRSRTTSPRSPRRSARPIARRSSSKRCDARGRPAVRVRLRRARPRAALVAALVALGYEEPTPIQRARSRRCSQAATSSARPRPARARRRPSRCRCCIA